MTKRRRLQSGFNFDSDVLRRFVGGDFVKRLSASDEKSAPLRIGQETWSTHRLATDLGVVHTRAARLLSEAAASIGAKDVVDLYQKSSPYTFAGVQGLGETTLYVLWRLFESRGLDPERWATAGTTRDAMVSFHSLKERERKAEARARREERAAARRERRAAHERAVEELKS